MSLSQRESVSSWPIISFNRNDSRSIRSSALVASVPARLRARSSATTKRASGERNSCEMSRMSRCCALTSVSMRVAIASKSCPIAANSSRRLPSNGPPRQLLRVRRRIARVHLYALLVEEIEDRFRVVIRFAEEFEQSVSSFTLIDVRSVARIDINDPVHPRVEGKRLARTRQLSGQKQ